MANVTLSILNTTDKGIWCYDLRRGKYTFANPSVALILDYAEENLPSPDTWLERIHPDDKPSVEKILAQQSKQEKVILEYRYITSSQAVKWITEERLMILDAQGQVLRMEGIISDISVQKAGEEENIHLEDLLPEAERNYFYLFEHNPNPMWIYDPATFQFLEVNHAAIQNYRYSREEFLRMTIKDIRPDEDIPVLEKNVRSTRKRLDAAGVWRHRQKNGNIRYANITSHKIIYKGKEARLVLAIDVTENINYQHQILSINQNLEQKIEERTRELYQKTLDLETANEEMTTLNEELQATNEEYQTANEQLITANEKIQEQAEIIRQQSEEKINRILNALHDMVWSIELPANQLDYVSPAVETIYGISMKEVFENPTFWSEMTYPDDKSLKDGKLAQAFSEDHAEYTYRIVRTDGAVRWLYERITVTHGNAENPIRIDGITSDITEFIEIQKALEQSEAQLKNAQRIAKIGSWETDLVNNKLYWSDEIYRIFGIAKEQQPPSYNTFLTAVHPDDREKVLQARKEAMADTKPYDIEHRIVLPNKKVKHVREVGEVTFDEKGRPVWFAGTVQDISDRKKMENKILETSERFALASESARIGVWEWNIRNNTLFWDKITCSIFEVNQEEFFGDFNTWTSFLHPDSASYAQQQVEIALRGEENYHAELKVITAAKSVIYVKTYANVLFDRQGQPKRMIGVMWDITWQKRAEEELIRYSERLDTVIESITNAFFIIDRDGKFIRANQTFTRLNHTTEEKLIGRNIWEAFPQLKGSNLQKVYQKAMSENKSVSFEIYHSSSQSWYDVSAYPSKEGLAVYARDITREKEAQQQIAFSQKNLDALINNTNDVIWSIDKKMKIVSANDAYKTMLATLTGRTEIKTGDPAITRTYEAQITQKFENYYRRGISGERFSVEESIMVPDKEVLYVEVSFNPMYDETGKVIGVGCFARDITERKKAEEEKLHLIQSLFAQNKYLEEFAFITSHNLRAPVARILGLTGIFNRKDLSDPFNLELVDNLEKSAQLLDEVIKDLAMILDIRKQEEEMREEIDFENILFEVKELLAQEIKKTGAEIRADFTKVPHIFTIKSYLRNIMLNLISNAIKYKKLNQIPRIFIESHKKAGYLCFSVKDNGLGLDMEKYGNQIFTLYKRFHSHTEGKGMGMYLVKSQADALGGKIRVYSKVNEGTTVKVCLKRESPRKEM